MLEELCSEDELDTNVQQKRRIILFLDVKNLNINLKKNQNRIIQAKQQKKIFNAGIKGSGASGCRLKQENAIN